MIFTNEMLLILIVSLLFCFMGFMRFVWFMSVGYGLSVAAIGATLLIMALAKGQIGVFFVAQCLLFIAYGIRLGGFLFIRELKNANYRKKLADVGGEVKVPIFVSIVSWIFCGALYVAQTSSGVFRLMNGLSVSADACAYIGLAISIGGAVMEAVADKQKSQAKAINPNMPAMQGLYNLCRCPNYFGELLVWTGAFISGFHIYQQAQWLIAIFGFVAIFIIMLSGTKRVETRHIKYYGDKPEYHAYADSTPLLIPFVPFYHITTPEKIAKEAAKKATKAKKHTK